MIYEADMRRCIDDGRRPWNVVIGNLYGSCAEILDDLKVGV